MKQLRLIDKIMLVSGIGLLLSVPMFIWFTLKLVAELNK